MYQKNCDNCHRPSFSSSETGDWLCPVCGNDLTKYPYFDAMTLERIHVQAIPFHRKMDCYKEQIKSLCLWTFSKGEETVGDKSLRRGMR